MNAQTPFPAATDDNDDAFDYSAGDVERWAQPLIERQMARLEELTEAGLRIALALCHQATGGADDAAPDALPEAPSQARPVSIADIGLAYDRVARAMRMTVALQSKLIEDLRNWDIRADGIYTIEEQQFRRDRPSLEKDEKACVGRIVERIAQAQHRKAQHQGEPDAAAAAAIDRLVAEAAERLDDEDLYGDMLYRPFSEVVADICRDLGLEPDWSALSKEAWAREEIAGGKVGAPLAAVMAANAHAHPPPRHEHPTSLPPDDLEHDRKDLGVLGDLGGSELSASPDAASP